MKLFYRELGEGKPLVILHGLFGSSDNWLSIGKILAENHHVYLLDQRNHGQSPHSSNFTYEAMAEDLSLFLKEHQVHKPTIMGHSMGGKVAMQFATSWPELLNDLIVVDIAPKSYPVHHDGILEGLVNIDLNNLKTRSDANEQLSGYVKDNGIRQFLLKNLTRTDEGFAWKINLPVIKEEIQEVGVGLDESQVYQGRTLFIRGEKSNYINDEDRAALSKHFPNSTLETIEKAGHWLHAEQPALFLAVVQKFLTP